MNLELKGGDWLEMLPMINDPACGTDKDKEMDEGREKKRALDEVLRRPPPKPWQRRVTGKGG